MPTPTQTVIEAKVSTGTGRQKLEDKTLSHLADSSAVGANQAITEAGAIDLAAPYVAITGPAASTYAVTLAAPLVEGVVKVIKMVATTATNAVTLALTNAVGGTAATSASFDAAGETLVLIASAGKWVVVKEVGVTLS